MCAKYRKFKWSTRLEPALTHSESIAFGSIMQMVGRLLVEELNPELIAILQQPEIMSVFCELDSANAEYLTQTWDAAAYEQAAVDYCYLFVLPKGVSPMAAAWHDKGAPSEQASVRIQHAVATINAQWDLTLPPNFRELPPEHTGLLYFIAGRLACAEDPEAQQQALPFLQTTTAGWLESFHQALTASSTPSFYRSVGALAANMAQMK